MSKLVPLIHHVLGKGDAQFDEKTQLINGKTVSESLWNFAYELNDPNTLREEHIAEATKES